MTSEYYTPTREEVEAARDAFEKASSWPVALWQIEKVLQAAKEVRISEGWKAFSENEILPFDWTAHQIDGHSGDSINVQVLNGVFSFEIECPWAGDTESGFGQTCRMSLTTDQVEQLSVWLSRSAAKVRAREDG